MSKSKEASAMFRQGFNCSQSVLAAFFEGYGIPRETALKIGCGFGGGMRNGELCGAVSGAVMVIGLKYGSEDSESKSLCYQKTKEYTEKFKAKKQSIICRELLGCDISTADGMDIAIEKDLFKTTCADMVSSAAELLEELGY
ncbi:MAG: C-GCAxxG-C-C family protein [Oscillospiraceae bacterium]|nr:C-GCAxxG-C-C family protein [Oscillospiraceae bacterium]